MKLLTFELANLKNYSSTWGVKRRVFDFGSTGIGCIPAVTTNIVRWTPFPRNILVHNPKISTVFQNITQIALIKHGKNYLTGTSIIKIDLVL